MLKKKEYFLVFQTEPDLIREGGTIPIARNFQDVTGKSIVMLPIGGFDDGLHSQNEKMSRSELLFSRKPLTFKYLYDSVHLFKPSPSPASCLQVQLH